MPTRFRSIFVLPFSLYQARKQQGVSNETPDLSSPNQWSAPLTLSPKETVLVALDGDCQRLNMLDLAHITQPSTVQLQLRTSEGFGSDSQVPDSN